ncbi:MAG TPA: hypothetical protein VJ783_10945 [Pirellulales bacterium]|nr:hypothetical protein [Pirellulales bacterium]
MKALTSRTTIGPDGTIDVHLPTGLPPGEAEVVVVVQPVTAASTRAAPPYASDHGIWKGKLPDDDIDADLREMNALWEKGMELPE